MTKHRDRYVWASLAGALACALLVATAAGSVSLSFPGVLGALAAKLGLATSPSALGATGETILFTVRLPRVLLAAIVGGGLAVVGAVLQAVFGNPLADAGLLGVGAGAALGAVAAVDLGLASTVFFALPLAAFAGALASVLAVYAIASAAGRASLHGLLLTGIAVSALASALTSVLLVATEEFRVKAVLFWLAGGLEGRGWSHVQAAAAFVLSGVALLLLLGRLIDVLALGEDEAASLGLPVRATRLLLLGTAALVAGAATAVAGSVPFVGLMAPHALRPLVGPLSRRLLPAAFLGGATLVVLADLGARAISPRFELPLGAVTACVGAPYFLLALRANEGRG